MVRTNPACAIRTERLPGGAEKSQGRRKMSGAGLNKASCGSCGNQWPRSFFPSDGGRRTATPPVSVVGPASRGKVGERIANVYSQNPKSLGHWAVLSAYSEEQRDKTGHVVGG